MERRREWDHHATRMDVERLVKISWDNIPAGKSSEDIRKEYGAAYNKNNNRKKRMG